MALVISATQYARRSPDPLSTMLRIRKQNMPTPIMAISKHIATGLMARFRFKNSNDTTSYESAKTPNTTCGQHQSGALRNGRAIPIARRTDGKERRQQDVDPGCRLPSPVAVQPSDEGERPQLKRDRQKPRDCLGQVELDAQLPDGLDSRDASPPFGVHLSAVPGVAPLPAPSSEPRLARLGTELSSLRFRFFPGN